MQFRSFVLPVLVLAALARPAPAAEQTLTVDAAASKASFVLDATGHKVHGKLAVTAGTITFDAASGQASGKIEIDARRGRPHQRSSPSDRRGRAGRPAPRSATSAQGRHRGLPLRPLGPGLERVCESAGDSQLTTLAGFGAIGFSAHRGLASFGQPCWPRTARR